MSAEKRRKNFGFKFDAACDNGSAPDGVSFCAAARRGARAFLPRNFDFNPASAAVPSRSSALDRPRGGFLH